MVFSVSVFSFSFFFSDCLSVSRMAFVGFVGLFFLNSPQSALNTLAQDYFDTLSSYPLSVIPTFILMGSFAYASGISQKLYAACYTWFGALRGGLTIATVARLLGFCRRLRINGRHRGDHGKNRHPGDEEVQLQ